MSSHTGSQPQRKETLMTGPAPRELAYYRLHIDLLRVSSALCPL
ncbi:putative leader peptide [Kribbella qitaiheensis]